MTTRRGVRGCSCVTVPLPYDPRRSHMRVVDPDCPTHRRAPLWMRAVSWATGLVSGRTRR